MSSLDRGIRICCRSLEVNPLPDEMYLPAARTRVPVENCEAVMRSADARDRIAMLRYGRVGRSAHPRPDDDLRLAFRTRLFHDFS
jgi:hypothetical protein